MAASANRTSGLPARIVCCSTDTSENRWPVEPVTSSSIRSRSASWPIAPRCPTGSCEGGFPELYARRELDASRYLEDYVRTFVEKDVAASAGILQTDAFLRALQLLAARTGTLLNATDIGQQVGVKGQTVSGWLDLLQQNALALRLPRTTPT